MTISAAQLDGIGTATGEALAKQRAQFEARLALLESRIASLERVLGSLIAPATIAQAAQPPDGAPARH